MSDEFDESSDPEQWDEFEWEKFMKERDEASERFSRFIEEHGDDPDFGSSLAREIGVPPEFLERGDDRQDVSVHYTDNEGEIWKTASGIEPEQAAGESIPDSRSDGLYRKAFDFAVDSIGWLQELPEEVRRDPEIQEAFSQALMPAAKIANALDDGSDDPDMLGYRIAAYKIGLAAANRSIEMMGRIRGRNLLDKTRLLSLEHLAAEVRNGIACRILEVRTRFDEG